MEPEMNPYSTQTITNKEKILIIEFLILSIIMINYALNLKRSSD